MMAKYKEGVYTISDLWNAQDCGKIFKLKKNLIIGWSGEGRWEFQNYLNMYHKTHRYPKRIPAYDVLVQDVEAALRDIPRLQKHWLEVNESNPSKKIEDAVLEFIHKPEYTGLLPDPDESFELFLPRYQEYWGLDGVHLSPSQTLADFALEWAKIAGYRNTIIIGSHTNETFSLYISPSDQQKNVCFEQREIAYNTVDWPEIRDLTRQHSPRMDEREIKELLRECLYAAAHIPDTGIPLDGRFESKLTHAGYAVLVFNPHEKY